MRILRLILAKTKEKTIPFQTVFRKGDKNDDEKVYTGLSGFVDWTVIMHKGDGFYPGESKSFKGTKGLCPGIFTYLHGQQTDPFVFNRDFKHPQYRHVPRH